MSEKQSTLIIEELRKKAATWQKEKEDEIIKQVIFLKNITTRSSKLSSTFLDSSYIDVAKQLDNIKSVG